MRTLTQEYVSGTINPLEFIERIVEANEWPFDRPQENELTVSVAGTWCDYHLYFTWRADVQALQITCAFDCRVPDRRKPAVFELLSMVNERMWIGHFDVWSEGGFPMFRHTLLLGGEIGSSPKKLEDLIEIALNECERFYPAFQFVMWAGKSPDQAIAACMFETAGEA